MLLAGRRGACRLGAHLFGNLGGISSKPPSSHHYTLLTRDCLSNSYSLQYWKTCPDIALIVVFAALQIRVAYLLLPLPVNCLETGVV